MTVVVDASVVVAALIETGSAGRWALETLAGVDVLSAPHHMPAEVTNIIRRTEARGALAPEVAALVLAELSRMPVDLYPFQPFAGRAHELRANLTTYDAWYVATAENLDAPLATLDAKLRRAAGPRCRFLSP
jgi:predicted nucleic acid-binding protein